MRRYGATLEYLSGQQSSLRSGLPKKKICAIYPPPSSKWYGIVQDTCTNKRASSSGVVATTARLFSVVLTTFHVLKHLFEGKPINNDSQYINEKYPIKAKGNRVLFDADA